MQSISNMPIGVFDSGVGGLSAVKEIRRLMPGEDIIYFGDTGRVPYGNRSQQTIKKYAAQAIKYLLSFNVKAIVAACGTVSTNFSDEDYNKLGTKIPYISIVDPAVNAAVVATKNNRVAVMATTASIKSGEFERKIKLQLPAAAITNAACPLLVSLAESGITDKDHPVVQAVLDMYLAPLKAAGVDTIILGCTHFPILKEAIYSKLASGITLIDSGAAVAAKLKQLLRQQSLLNESKTGTLNCYVTDSTQTFAEVAASFLEEDVFDNVVQIDIDLIDR